MYINRIQQFVVPILLSLILGFYATSKATYADNWTLSGTDLYNSNDGRVGINIIPPRSIFHVGDGNSIISVGLGLDAGNVVLTKEGSMAGLQGIVASGEAAGHGMNLEGIRARGALAVPAVPVLDDSVLTLTGKIFDGNAAQSTAQIEFLVDGIVSANVAPQRISFLTSGTDGAGKAERLLIKSGGQVVIPGSVGIGTGRPGGLLGLKDANTHLDVDINGNLTFTDIVAGTKTLAQLATEGEAETDPVFNRSAAAGITGADIGNWNAAYSLAGQSSTTGNPGTIQPAGITTTNYVQKWDGAALTDSAIYDNNGSIGIGTTNPSYTLEVIRAGNGNFMIKNTLAGAANSTALDMFNNDETALLSIGIHSTLHGGDPNTTFFINNSNSDMKFATNSVERLRIKGDGKVGIGTSLPTATLEVLGTAPKFTTDGGQALTNIIGYGGAANPLNGVRIDSSRGTLATPAPLLAGDRLGNIEFNGMPDAGGIFAQSVQITGTATENWSATGHGGKLQFYTTANGTATPPVERMVINHDGNIGINTTTPQSIFHVGDGNNTISGLLGLRPSNFVLTKDGGETGFEGIVASSGAPGHRMNFEGVRARGTLASPIVPILDDRVLTLTGKIFDGNTAHNTAQITFFVDGTVSTGVAPQRISFRTSQTDTGSKQERLLIKSNGQVIIPGTVAIGTTTPNPAAALDVNGAIYQRGGVLHADYVFEPGYELESIREHAEFMWKNKHLKAIPKARVDSRGREIVEIGSHRKGIVEELEKAHIYISQLEEKAAMVEALKTENESINRHNRSLEARLANIEKLLIQK